MLKFLSYPMALTLLTAASLVGAQTPAPSFPDAARSDPIALGWMVGSPPPADKLVQFADGSAYSFPRLRWSFSNFRQMVPTTQVGRGLGAVQALPRRANESLSKLEFLPLGQSVPMNWEDSLAATYTDGIVVLHRGQVVYERYTGALKPEGQHIAMSVTKSFFGVIAAALIAEGKLDETRTVASYVPELAGTAFADATIRQVLDMTTGLQYSENYSDPKAEIWTHVRAGGVLPRPPGYDGPRTFYDFLRTVKKSGEHGEAFAYKTVNTDALGWVIRRVTGKSIGQNLSEMIWSQLGMEQDAYFTVDSVGNEFAGGGLNTGLRDLARFGEMIRNNGRASGKQILPEAAILDIRRGGRKADFAKAAYPLLPGWSYRSMWWITHNEHGAIMARGVHGQSIYVDPMAEMVIARYASHPVAANAGNDPVTLPAFHAMAKALMKN